MISVKQKNNFSQSISRDHVVITDFWTLTDNNEIQLPSNMEIICNNYLKSLKLMYQKITLNDSQLLEVNLLNQLKLAKRVNLFDYSLEELQAVHEYWRSMNRYSKQVLNKEKVA